MDRRQKAKTEKSRQNRRFVTHSCLKTFRFVAYRYPGNLHNLELLRCCLTGNSTLFRSLLFETTSILHVVFLERKDKTHISIYRYIQHCEKRLLTWHGVQSSVLCCFTQITKAQNVLLYFDTLKGCNSKTLWPSGLRRNVKAVVFIGGGSNPPGVIFPF